CKDRALARTRPNVDRVPQQFCQTLHDREAEADALAALAGRIVELMKLLEDRRKLLGRDANAGIPDLDAQFVAAPPATEQNLAFAGVLDRVGEQVAHHLFEQAGIAAHAQTARDHAPT